MKIVDEKGRLFGKINVIDFLVVLFLACLIAMFYFGYITINKRRVADTTSKQSIVNEQKKEDAAKKEVATKKEDATTLGLLI